jgi:lipopolysaccharide biosynthesis glycosyltransferase
VTGARDSVVIVCATDVNYVRPVTVMLRSALANLSPDRTASIQIKVAAFAGDSEEQKRTASEPATARRSQ